MILPLVPASSSSSQVHSGRQHYLRQARQVSNMQVEAEGVLLNISKKPNQEASPRKRAFPMDVETFGSNFGAGHGYPSLVSVARSPRNLESTMASTSPAPALLFVSGAFSKEGFEDLRMPGLGRGTWHSGSGQTDLASSRLQRTSIPSPRRFNPCAISAGCVSSPRAAASQHGGKLPPLDETLRPPRGLRGQRV